MSRGRQHRGMVTLMLIDPMLGRPSKIHVVALPLTWLVSPDCGQALLAPTDRTSEISDMGKIHVYVPRD